MKKGMFLAIIYFISSLFLLNGLVYANSETSVYEGMRITKVPVDMTESWTKEDLQISMSSLLIKKLNVNGINLHLQGELIHESDTYRINKVGTIKKSPEGDNVWVVDFGENKSNSGLNLVHTKLVKGATNTNFDLPETRADLIGKDIVSFIFLNNDTNELFTFEEELRRTNGVALEKLSELDHRKLQEVESPGWAWKVFDPYSIEIENINVDKEIQEGKESFSILQNSGSNSQIRQECGSFQCIKDIRAVFNYKNYLGQTYETHTLDARTFSRYSNRRVNTAVRVLKKTMQSSGGPVYDGSSVISLGHYDNPVVGLTELVNDRLTAVDWHTPDANHKPVWSWGVGFSYSIFSFSTELDSQTGLNRNSGQRSFDEFESNLPTKNRFIHSDSRLDKVDQRYDVNYDVRWGSGSMAKSVEVAFWLPFHESTQANTFTTRRVEHSINY